MLTLFRDYPFLTPLLVMLASEVTKHLFEGTYRGIWFQHGGMPSSHSAFVTSLLIVVGFTEPEGLQSGAFAVAAVLAAIVWYDAAFVRSQVGRQARILNILQQFHRFSERVGHSILEVTGGIIFGSVLTAMIMALLY
ncbi:MAG TPA: divergent PAP2 family protein [Candidatus Peribacteraceae bacterium]|nr:divergent PAP2 family protein [Candidatus Peribacteraceae bacterium]